jgi:endoglucanase
MDPFEQNRRLGRGVNIIGYDPIWKDRTQARFQQKLFGMIRAAGFQHVRINLHPFSHMGDGPEFHIDPAYLETLDWAVENSLAAGLLVVIDLHEFMSISEDPDGLKPKFMAAWSQLASRYQHHDERVVFELLNEPNKLLTPAVWNAYYREPYALLRETNPNRTIILGGAWWNGIDHLHELELPAEDRNLIITVHFYHPMEFTHQGAPWTEHVDLHGVRWEGTPEEQAYITGWLSKAQAWSEQNQRPLYLGEFGAYDQADMESRVRWTSFVTRQAEAYGWSWAYWQFDSDFIVYNIERDEWVEPILNALIPPTGSSK